MTDVSKALERIATVPWRMVLAVLGASFLIASVASTFIAHMFLPDASKPGAKKTVAVTSAAVNIPDPTASLNQSAIDQILKRNLFNSEGSADDTVAKTDDKGPKSMEAVKSDLPIKLQGTIYGGDPFSGIALVENNDKHSINSFMVGDTLLKDTTVKEVHKEKIIIDHNGRLEYVEVVREGLSRSRRKKKAATVTASSDSVAPIATDPPPAAFKEEGFERKDRDMSMTQAYRSKLLTTDFTKVLQDAKASPNMVDGELRGFILNRIRKDSIYEKAGFQNEDIVTEVNGVPLNDVQQAIRLLNSLRNESEIEVRIIRGGTPQKFNLNIR